MSSHFFSKGKKARIYQIIRQKQGVTLLLVVILISTILSISVGIFTVVFGQLFISGEVADSFVAMYSSDHGIERTLYRDRLLGTGIACSTSCIENSMTTYGGPLASGGCYIVSMTKIGGTVTFESTGQYRCLVNSTRVVKRSFRLSYLDPALVGYWKFNEGTGQTTQDLTGLGNTGTLGTTAGVDSSDPSWENISGSNYALKYDGTNDVVNAGSGSSLDMIPALTLTTWIYPESNGEAGQGHIFQKGTMGGVTGIRSHLLSSPPGIRLIVDYTGTDLRRDDAPPIANPNQWTHLAITWDGSTSATGIRIYRNGVEASYDAFANGTLSRGNDSSSNLWIGNTSNLTRTTDGCIDEMKMWKRVLTPAEITADYNTSQSVYDGKDCD